MAKVMALDAGCTFLNLITPNRKPGSVTPHGSLGADGKWPEFVPAKEGDSRILPHDGKDISFIEMGDLIRATYNFSPSFCLFVPKDYHNDRFDLKDLDLHNGIEHDASLCRIKIPVEMIKALLAEATGKDADGKPLLTIEDLSRFSARRRIHKSFGSSNASTLLTVFGGRVEDIETVLLEERLPDGWRYGLTIITFNLKAVNKFIAEREDKKEP
ncbi:hypothetical protein FA13DRAFT_1759383 [Coprinellus micaceus]|uniref:Heme haloperoxidase family profile domain-containing protein n=1 Tax=Coprinellus micaceus TaxID=71717 RepID=A0A4Y7S0A8_COPMI|nr:hypothetical protein FA13DRAFT_1759383 [Coprinellus micaceus]